MTHKPGINPVTIRRRPGDPCLTLGRLHIGPGGGGPMVRTLTAVVHGDDDGGKVEAHVVLDEDDFVAALGHLFPSGRLAAAHLDAMPAPTDRPLPADAVRDWVGAALKAIVAPAVVGHAVRVGGRDLRVTDVFLGGSHDHAVVLTVDDGGGAVRNVGLDEIL